jgi:transposase-like protein
MENMKKHVKADSKDYSMSFKLQIVQEIERTTCYRIHRLGIQNRSTVVKWLRKFGNFDWENQTPLLCQSHEKKKIMFEPK